MAKIAVMGAGAVGCYYGALLAESGAEVILIGRPALAEAVEARGLILEVAGVARRVDLTVAKDASGVRGADLVLVAVKSGDSAAAAAEMLPHLSPDAIVLSLQNGVSNAEVLAQALGRPVVPVVVYVAVEMAGAGHVRHKGRGELILGEAAGAAYAAQILRDAGITAEVSPEALSVMWTKFICNCVFNALSALSRQPYGVIAREEGALEMMRDVMEECLRVAKAEGVALPDPFWPHIQGIIDGMPSQFSSTAQDMKRGKPTEIDHLNGEILRRAKRHGLAVPVNQALWVMVKLAQRAERE